MSSSYYIVASGAVAAGFLFWSMRSYINRKSVSYIRGPPAPSLLLGHERILGHQEETGDLEFKWFREYGAVFRIYGCYGQQILSVADPKALQYIFQTSGYHSIKPNEETYLIKELFGNGIISAKGKTHQRHRKVMLPAFSVSQLRSYLGIYQSYAAKMEQKWMEKLQDGAAVLNVMPWLNKTTLDVIGEAAFEYKFESLDGGQSELSEAMKNMFVDSSLYPSNWDLLYSALWRILPTPVLSIMGMFPTKQIRRFQKFITVANKVASEVLKERLDSYLKEDTETKDAMSVLIRSNNAEDGDKKLSDEEVIAQMATLIVAGHDTTAGSITWLLWELAKHPEYQAKIRQEVRSLRQEKSGEFSSSDYDSLHFLNTAIKETLRFHSFTPTLRREADRDDVIPLSEPIITADGRTISEIPVSKGQYFRISICTYNRLRSVWGEDADQWNPERFWNPPVKKQTSVGMVANLMTFSAGLQGCIGWRFSMMEMQVIASCLLEHFEFAIPKEGLDIVRLPAGFMVPMIRDKFDEGPQMPLYVTPLEEH